VLRAAKPEHLARQGETLGARLRRRRHELGLRRVDAAALMSVNEKSLMYWERDERPPFAHHYPAIIRFLDAEPWPGPATLGERLMAERRRRGLSIAGAAQLVGVDEGTFARWELRTWRHQSRSLQIITAFLGGS
jgi:transcriptional regulator with XRE-family HTH domain